MIHHIVTETNFSATRLLSECTTTDAATSLEGLHQTKSSYESADSGCDIADMEVNTNQSPSFNCGYLLPSTYISPLEKMDRSPPPLSHNYDAFSLGKSSISSASPIKTSPPFFSPSCMSSLTYQSVNSYHQSPEKQALSRKPKQTVTVEEAKKASSNKQRSSKSNITSTDVICDAKKSGDERGSGASYKFLSWREKDRRRRFREEWKHLWLVVPYGSYEVMCLVCHKIMTQRKLDTIKRHTIRRHAQLLTMSELDRQHLYYELVSQRFRHLGEQRSRELFLEETNATKLSTFPDPFNDNNCRIPSVPHQKLGGLMKSPCYLARSRGALGPTRSNVRRPRTNSQNQTESISSFRSVMGSGRGGKKCTPSVNSRSEEMDQSMKQMRKIRDDIEQPNSETCHHSPNFPKVSVLANTSEALANEVVRSYAQRKSALPPGEIKQEAISIFSQIFNSRRFPPLGMSLCSEMEQKNVEQIISGANLQIGESYPPNLVLMAKYLMNLHRNPLSHTTGNDFMADIMRYWAYGRREKSEPMPANISSSQPFGLKRPSMESCFLSPKENLHKLPNLEVPSTSIPCLRFGFRAPSSTENSKIFSPANGCASINQPTSNQVPCLLPGFTGAQLRGSIQRFPNFIDSTMYPDCLDAGLQSKETFNNSEFYSSSSLSKAIDINKNRSPKMDTSSLTERLNRLVNTWDSGRKPNLSLNSFDVSLMNRN